MQKTVKVVHTVNDEYNNRTGDGFATSEIEVFVNGVRIWWQDASESLQECPEDALFHRDLNDPAEVINLIQKLVGDDGNYNLFIEEV